MSIWTLSKKTPYSEMFKTLQKNNETILNVMNENFDYSSMKVNIIAKGPSATYIKNAHAVNQGLVFTNKMYVYMNDLHSIFGVEEYIKDIKIIFIPDTPHIYGYAYEDISFIDFLVYLKKHQFIGDVFVYKIQTSKLPHFDFFKRFTFTTQTTTDIPIQIMNRYFGLNEFNTYGYGLHSSNVYHTDMKVIYQKKKERLESLIWLKQRVSSQSTCKNISEKFIKLENILNTKTFLQINPLENPKDVYDNKIVIHKY